MTALLLFCLTFMLPLDEPEQLQTYIRVESYGQEPQIGVFCDIFPKTLTVGDMLYINVTTKNISKKDLKYKLYLNTLGRPYTIGSDGLLLGTVTIHRNSTEELAGASFGYIVRAAMPPAYSLNIPTCILQSESTMTAYVRPLLVPTPDHYDRPLWVWNDFGKEERVLLTFNTTLYSARTESTGISAVEKSETNSVTVTQELKIKPRPKEELQLIKEWYEKTRWFGNFWRADSPTAMEWREFEEQLTPGTLRNRIHMIRTLVEIAQDENKGKRQAMFDEMLAWINELHPLEKEGLTKQAYEIVRNWVPYANMGNEITVPNLPNYRELV